MNYYTKYLSMYLVADNATRAASKEHWLKCHTANLESNRDDMICFSAQILAVQAIADDVLKNKVIA